VQETHDEGDQSTGAAVAGGPEGLGQHQYRIEFRAQGFEGAFARASQFTKTIPEVTQHPKGSLIWSKYCFGALTFSQTTACIVLQGADLRNIFTARACCVLVHTHTTPSLEKVEEHILDYGPFYLLKGVPSPVHDPPLRLKNVVMARLGTQPEGLSDLEIVTFLIMAVCPP
jgi:hypothetical protein